MAERIHELVTTSVPTLVPRTYYGMPAYAKDGKTICFFKPTSKFKVRYSTFGFEQHAQARRRRHVAGRVRGREADPGGREADRRAREEGRGLTLAADWGAIEVRGARENNLRNVSLDIPKRRLTVFTGVSGSGKSSLVFGTDRRRVAAADQRDVQRLRPGLHADAGAAGRRLPRGADDRDHPRPGADGRQRPLDGRHGHRRQRDAAGRVQPARRSRTSAGPQAFSFNVPSVRGGGAIKVERGAGRTESRTFSVAGGMCPRCEGIGTATDDRPDAALRRDQVAQRGCDHGSRATPPTAGRRGCSASPASSTPTSRSATTPRQELDDFLYRESTKVKINGINLTYEGLVPRIQKSMLSKDVDALQPHIRAFVERAVTFSACPECGGTRLNEAARSSKIDGRQHRRRLRDADQRPRRVGPRPRRAVRRAAARGAAATSLDSFVEIGLGYLSLDRPSGTLSGGEAQRTRMIRHLGSALTDVTYVFDEPTIGLHAHDVERMNALLRRLRDKGNTVLVVEHDPEVIAIADHVVDMGPGAGPHGGTVVFEGTVDGLVASGTATGRHLDVPADAEADAAHADAARSPIRNARLHNLQDVSVDVPLGVLVAVTGVAGSGKSSLIHGCLPRTDPSVTVIDQSAIRGSRRSNPATYTGILDPIRTAFAKANGVKPALFSANSEGACPDCNGLGMTYTSLGFMAEVVERLRGLRGPSLHRRRARVPAARPEHRRGPRACRSRRRASSSPRSRSQVDARPAGGRRAGLRLARPGAGHALGRRAPAAQARDRDVGATPRSTCSTSRRPASTCRTSTT